MTGADVASGLGAPGFFAGEPDDVLAVLRRGAPVQRVPGEDFVAVLGHEEVQAVSKDPSTYCSGKGVLLSDRGRDVAAADSILFLDPPAHGQYRKLVSRAFTPRRVAELEPRIRALTVELLDAVDPAQPVDLVEALTAPLPLWVIAELLGLPPADRADFRRWSDAIMAAATEITDENAALALELIMYFDAQLDLRDATPTDDLLGALTTAEVDGERLTRAELIGFCMSLLVAGNETTRALLSGGIVALAEHPDQRAALAADPSVTAGAVEEMLRWVTPITTMTRTATCPAELGGAALAEGDCLALVYAAANRDETVFGADADRFDIGRAHNPHVAFGFGEHFCIGAGLARIEARVVLDELLARWPTYEVAGAVERVPSTLLRQIARLPVLLDP